MLSIIAKIRDVIRKRQQKPFAPVTQDKIDLKSPLIECCEGDLLPGVLSIQDRQICNDATILTQSPLSVIMPQQQWSYGLLLPINHANLASASEGIVIQLKLAVRNGDIGVAGIDASLKTLTTLERFVESGQTTVTLTIDDVQRTKAIVLRTTSAKNEKPELTLLEVTAHRPADMRLVRRRHDLGFDLFVILSPGKTATQTIEQTILSLDPSVQVRRLHFLSRKGIEDRMKSARLNKSSQLGLETEQVVVAAENVNREIEMVRALGGTIAFVTSMREPIDRAISGIFQLIPFTLPFYAQLHEAGPWLVKLLSEVTIKQWRQVLKETNPSAEREYLLAGRVNIADEFFLEEFTPLIGVDILRHPIDRDAGFTLLKNGRTSTLLFRYEDIDWGLAPGLSALTGRKDIKLKGANLSVDKAYTGLYREFRGVFRVPADLCSAIYDKSPYIRHFYSDIEIAQFKARWSDSNSAGL